MEIENKLTIPKNQEKPVIKLVKSPRQEERIETEEGGDEDVDHEKMSQPQKKMRVCENPSMMKTFRNLFDYRFGIEKQEQHKMEIEAESKKPLASPVKKAEIVKPKKQHMKDEEDEFENFLNEVKAQDMKELEAMRMNREFEEDSNSRGLKDENPPADEEEPANKDLKDLGVNMNLNKHLTDEFEKLLRAYINEKDKGRMHAYRKAIAAIRGLPFRIENADQVKNVSGVGQKIRDKIAEILKTGKLKKADEFVDEKQTVLNILTKVWGVGVQTATSLYNRGIHTIADLRKHQFLLNDNQKIGLKYYEEFEQRIPREDVSTIVEIITMTVNELAGEVGLYDVVCCGSYRRGRATCGDIDVLLTRTDGKSFAGFLSKLVKGLKGTLITDDLTQAKMSPLGSETYMGVCIFNDIHRRIDIKIYPKDQYGYALLYFTGSDYFNRSIRLFALKKDWSLSDHGLSRVVKTDKGTKTTSENLPCYTEEEVFNVLGLKYRRPQERDV